MSDTITHANSAIEADAAAFLVLVSERFLKIKFKKEPRFWDMQKVGSFLKKLPWRQWGNKKLLDQTGITLSKVTFIELMEAYAAQAILCTRECNLDLNKINIRGGALSRVIQSVRQVLY